MGEGDEFATERMKKGVEPFPGGLSWAASWPRETPSFRRIEPQATLWTPLIVDGLGRPVAAGDRVSRGELISDGNRGGIVAADGRVVSVANTQLAGKAQVAVLGIDVSADERAPTEQWVKEEEADLHMLPAAKTSELDAWIDRLKEGAIWADRKSSPNLWAQLVKGERRAIDTVVCNLLDHEPPLRLNTMLSAYFAPSIVAAVKLLKDAVHARRAIVVADRGKTPDLLHAALTKLALQVGIEVVRMRPRYPQGDPTLLISALLDRPLKPGNLPVEQGVLLIDGAAAVAIGRRILHGKPMCEVPVAVRDRVRGNSHYLFVPVGMRVGELLKVLGMSGAHKVRGGDLLRDVEVKLDAVVGGSEACLHVMSADVETTSAPCIRCGWCLEDCPVQIDPPGLLAAAQDEDKELARQSGIETCITCGVCEYVCPSHLPLAAAIRGLKRMMGSSDG